MEPQEIWKPIIGFGDKYFISNLGGFKTITTVGRNEKILKQEKVNFYLRIELHYKSKVSKFYTHVMVAKYFIDNPYNKPKVNHLDNNPLNNRAENLEWCTQKENIHYSIKQGRHKLGKKTCILLNTQTGIFYYGYDEASKSINATTNQLRGKFWRKKPCHTQFIRA